MRKELSRTLKVEFESFLKIDQFVSMICSYSIMTLDMVPFETCTHSQEASRDFPATAVVGYMVSLFGKKNKSWFWYPLNPWVLGGIDGSIEIQRQRTHSSSSGFERSCHPPQDPGPSKEWILG